MRGPLCPGVQGLQEEKVKQTTQRYPWNSRGWLAVGLPVAGEQEGRPGQQRAGTPPAHLPGPWATHKTNRSRLHRIAERESYNRLL